MINTSSGGTLVLKEGVSGFFLQEFSSTGEVTRIQETIPIKKESKMSEDEYVSDDQILQEEQNREGIKDYGVGEVKGTEGPEGIQGNPESGNWDVGFSGSKSEPQNIEVVIDKIEFPEEVSNKELFTLTEEGLIYTPNKEVETMADEVVTDNKINEKFISFREKFLDLEGSGDSFENQIIEKMARRVEKLKDFADILDKENDFLEEFKKEKLG